MMLKHCSICNSSKFSLYYHAQSVNANYWQCDSCKTITLDLALWPKDIRAHYNEYYDEGFQGRKTDIDHFRKRAEVAVPYVPKGGNIFEVGAASGESLHVFAEHGFHVGGSELSQRAVAAAKKNYNIHLVQGTLFDAHLPNNSYDVVMLHHVLEHIEEPHKLLYEIYRVLKPSGMIVLEVPNPKGIDAFISQSLRESILDFPHHLFAFPLKSLKNILLEHHFSIAHIDMQPSYWLTSRIRKLFGKARSSKKEETIVEKGENRSSNFQMQGRKNKYVRSLISRIFPGMAYTVIAKKM